MAKTNIKIILLIIIFCVSIYIMDNKILDYNIVKTQEKNSILEAKKEGLTLDMELNKMIYFGKNLGNIVVNNIDIKKIDDYKYMNDFKEKLIPQFTDTIKIFQGNSGWFVFNSNLIKGANTLDFIKKGEIYKRQAEYDVVKSGYTKDSWWIESLKEEGYFSNPYYWKDWDSYIFSYSKGFYKGEELIGVSGLEFSFDEFYKLLDDENLSNKDIIILNGNFEYIYNSNENYETPIYYDEVRNRLKNSVKTSNSGILSFEFNKKKNTIAYFSLENNWKLLLKSNS
ncbi:hypothetical protein WG909_10790 [Peptostreptococcaceae bacterium AGR-M142]